MDVPRIVDGFGPGMKLYGDVLLQRWKIDTEMTRRAAIARAANEGVRRLNSRPDVDKDARKFLVDSELIAVVPRTGSVLIRLQFRRLYL